MDDVLFQLESLHLDSLDENWVQEIFNSEFLEISGFPLVYEEILYSINIKRCFSNILQAVDQWQADKSLTYDEKSWQPLSQNINVQGLLSVIYYYIDSGVKNVMVKEYTDNAIIAARLYYKLLSIPGYRLFGIYHPQLFTHSMTCLAFPRDVCQNDGSTVSAKERASILSSLMTQFPDYLSELHMVVETLQLKPDDLIYEDILNGLIDNIDHDLLNKFKIDKMVSLKFSYGTYMIIDALTSDSSGETNPCAIEVLFKCMLPKITNLLRPSYVTYTISLMNRYGKAAYESFFVLLQHICYAEEGLERAEVRLARVTLLEGLMGLLQKPAYFKFIDWVMKLSTTAKVVHRQIALEILSKILLNEMNTSSVQEDNMYDALFARPDHSAASTSTALVAAAPSAVRSTSADSGQESSDEGVCQETKEELVSQCIPYVDILHAVLDRVDDTSSTLRSRVLQILNSCLQLRSDRMRSAIQELSSGSGEGAGLLTVVVERCTRDERAYVRRAAATMLTRLLQIGTLDNGLLQSLVAMCRDVSVVVRSSAVAALGELVLRRPESSVMRAFIVGPLYQVYDPEAKIQEQVASLVQQVAIDGLQKHPAQSDAHHRQWRFLEAVTQCNVKKLLAQACLLLSKSSNCINYRLVEVLRSHLAAQSGTRSLHALLLLACAGKHVRYDDVTFLLDYYYALFKDDAACDPCLLELTLELMTTWSAAIVGEKRTVLHDHVVEALASGKLGREGCRPTCVVFAAHLDPHNLQWATDLMQMFQGRALSGGDVDSWLSAADLSLVAPDPPSAELTSLFINELSSDNADADADAVRRGVLVAGLARLCLRAREPAALAAPVLAAQLSAPPHHLPARLNALLALSDLCTRYTCIVEPQLGAIWACTETLAPPLLRRTAARELSRLLLGGFLRLRAPHYYSYCALLADGDSEVRDPVTNYVTRSLPADTIQHHFVESVLHYTGCGPHSHNATEKLDVERRTVIYDTMLQRLSPVQKQTLECSLAGKVLARAVVACDEDRGPLAPALTDALRDTLVLLCGHKLKSSPKPGLDEDGERVRSAPAAVSQKVKRTMAEQVGPVTLQLRARLQPGELAQLLDTFAGEILRDYKDEMEEVALHDEEFMSLLRAYQGVEEGTPQTEPGSARSARPARPARTPRKLIKAKRKLLVHSA